MTVLIMDATEARPYARLGRRIAELRRPLMNQRDLADRAHISHGYIPKIETGRTRPDAAVLRRIASVLEANYDELAVLAGYMNDDRDKTLVKVDDPEKAEVLRRMADWPMLALLEAETVIRALGRFAGRPQAEDAGPDRK